MNRLNQTESAVFKLWMLLSSWYYSLLYSTVLLPSLLLLLHLSSFSLSLITLSPLLLLRISLLFAFFSGIFFTFTHIIEDIRERWPMVFTRREIQDGFKRKNKTKQNKKKNNKNKTKQNKKKKKKKKKKWIWRRSFVLYISVLPCLLVCASSL